MGSGYRILWTDNALSELQATYNYLEANWTKRELKNLSIELESILRLISKNPKIFRESKKVGVRKVVVKKYNTLYYRENKQNRSVEILSFFSNRQNFNNLKIPYLPAGKVMQNCEPLLISLFTLILPLFLSVNSFTIINPSPVPFSCLVPLRL